MAGLGTSERSQNKSGWWHKITSLVRGHKGKWVRDTLKRKIGSGSGTKFWLHEWAGERPLSVLFPRLFHLSKEKEGYVSDMGYWENGEWVWNLKWRRELFERENVMIEQFLSVLGKIDLCAGTDDSWTWSASSDGIFNTKSAYLSLADSRSEQQLPTATTKFCKKIWKAVAPHKATANAWRLLKNRLPTCDNLIRRRIPLPEDEISCVACGQSGESAGHVFLHCSKMNVIWNEMQQWLGVSTCRPLSIDSHLNSFLYLGKNKGESEFLKTLWVCITWLVWKRRNECKFGNESWEASKIISEIKARMWSWCHSFSLSVPNISFSNWCSNGILMHFP